MATSETELPKTPAGAGSTVAWPARRRWFWILLTVLVCWWQVVPCAMSQQSGFPFVSFRYEPSPFMGDLRPKRNVLWDFFQEWASARNYFSDKPIYRDQADSVKEYLGLAPPAPSSSRPQFFLHYNAHPPTSVLMSLPLGLLDYPDAFLVWDLLSLAALGVSLALVVRQLRITWSWWTLLPVVTLLLICSPFRHQMKQGQLNLVLLLLLTGTWAAQRRGSPAWAGVWLGLATAIKIFPGFLLPYYAWRRQWRTVLVGIGTLVLVTALTAGVLGPDAYRSYAREVVPTLRHFQGSGASASVFAFWGRLFNPNNTLDARDPRTWANALPPLVWDRIVPLDRRPGLAFSAGLLSALALVGVLAWEVRLWRRGIQEDQAFGMAVTVMLLVSPLTWDHYFLLLLVPLAYLWLRLPPSGPERWLFRAVLVSVWLLLSFVVDATLPGGVKEGIAGPVHSLTTFSYQFYTLLVLFALEILEARNAARVEVQDPGDTALAPVNSG